MLHRKFMRIHSTAVSASKPLHFVCNKNKLEPDQILLEDFYSLHLVCRIALSFPNLKVYPAFSLFSYDIERLPRFIRSFKLRGQRIPEIEFPRNIRKQTLDTTATQWNET